MNALAFHKEVIPDSASINVWGFICHTFRLELLFIDLVGEIHVRKMEPQLGFASLEALREHYPDHTIVWSVPENDIPGSPTYGGPPGSHSPAIPYEYLHEFEHPEDNVIYVFGPDLGELKMRQRIQPGDKVINIKTFKRNRVDASQMHSVVAGAAVAYDRYSKILKNGNSNNS